MSTILLSNVTSHMKANCSYCSSSGTNHQVLLPILEAMVRRNTYSSTTNGATENYNDLPGSTSSSALQQNILNEPDDTQLKLSFTHSAPRRQKKRFSFPMASWTMLPMSD